MLVQVLCRKYSEIISRFTCVACKDMLQMMTYARIAVNVTEIVTFSSLYG